MAIPNPQSAFFNASIEETRPVLAATTASAQFTGGTLTPGRWLLQVVPSDPAAFVWVALGSSRVGGGVVTATIVGAAKQMPLCSSTITAVEFLVAGGFNDAAPAVICSAGTATCYLTRVSYT